MCQLERVSLWLVVMLQAKQLRALLFETAVLKAAAKPPFVLRARGSAGGGGGAVEADGVPGAGLTWTTPVSGLDGSCVCSDNGADPPDEGVWLCGR